MKLLRKNVGRRAADIRADIAKVDRAALAAKVSEVEQERRRLLLSGTDDQLQENKRDLDNAMLQVERAETLIDELTRLADEAASREAAEALEAEHADAMKAKADIDKALADAETVAAQLKAHLDRAAAATAVVVSWNRKASPVSADQPDRRIVYASLGRAKVRIAGMLR